MYEDQIKSLIEKTFGKGSGRIRLPAPPKEYEQRMEAEEITPLRAMQLISACWEHYSNGRNFYPTKIEKIIRYAKAIEAGEWKWSPEGDPIAITDGLVTGGRHRLHAVLLSHKTIKSNVLYQTSKEK